MILSLITIGVVLAIAYIWGSRGFFSALIHMLCVIVAGAIAFAAWEPVASMIIRSGAKGGSQWMIDVGYGVGLALPFALALAVLRLATNGLIGKNIDLDGATNMIGGALCGVISGVLTVGIGLISVSALRVEQAFLGWKPIVTGDNGSLKYGDQLWLPAERWTGRFYEMMSNSTFRVEDNLAKWRPNVADEGSLLRINFDDGKSKNVIPADAFEVLGHYTLDPKDAKDVLNDTIEPTRKRAYSFIDGTPAQPGQVTLEGYCVKFKPAGNEKSGRVIVGNSQVSLVVEHDGRSQRIQPIAVISEAENQNSLYSRWIFEGQKSFIATFNGRNDAPMSFEFPVPKGARPLALYVKGQRTRLDDGKVGLIATYDSIAARDAAILNKSIVPAAALAVIKSTPTTVLSNPAKWPGEPPMRVSDAIPFGIVMQKDDVGSLTLEENGRLQSGEDKFLNTRLAAARNADPKLQVRRFSVPEDVALIQVTVDGKNSEFGFLSTAAGNIDRSKAPVLVDESGQQYFCYGYVYRTPTETWIRYTPEKPMNAVSDAPTITRSQPNDQMVLLYRVGRNVKIKYFAVGEEAVAEINKPFAVTR
ncbi:MAG: hypothetical protein IT438_16680 [Phycisphaerales bacterium]|nr:hypothetical protein [Phycisphaerales bacterium]